MPFVQDAKSNRFIEQLAPLGPLEKRELLHGGHDGMSHEEWLDSQGGHSSSCGCACCSRGGLFVDGLINDETGAESGGSSDSDPLTAPTFNEAFSLHSNAGAKHTIYLDFDGHTFSNTIWNYGRDASITSKAFNMSGGESFTSSELDRIYKIWQRVAEDFMPFDVNVTTEDPGSAALTKSGGGDDAWGIRVVIGGSYSDWYGNSAGGVAYVGSFNWGSDTPTFVFSDSLGDNEKYVAEAISHEAGHTLGLSHDGQNSSGYYNGHGSGDTGWAPILGAGYYKNLTQWSKGEYSGANQTQDDLSILTGNNGFGYRVDDFGNSIGSAQTLTASNNNISVSGIIERNTDLDYFEFVTGSGQVDLSFDVAERGPNLDILARLYDASGNLIATSNPDGSLDASISTVLSAGTYYISIDGTGKGDVGGTGYSDYGSLGQYTLTGTVQSQISTPDVSISDTTVDEDTGTATFTVSLSDSSQQTVSVRVYTQDGTAAAGSDYTAINQTVTFAAGETTKTVTVVINDDSTIENTESFSVHLADATNANIDDGTGTGTISDNDTPLLSVGNATVDEDAGTATFTISLDRVASQTVTVRAYTQNGTASAGSDYTGINQTVTFAAGETTKTITVSITDDSTVENNETFSLKLADATNAGIDDGTGTGLINDNDEPLISVSDATVNEGSGTATFTVSLDRASNRTVTVRIYTQNGTASAGSDYTAINQTVTFAAGETSKTVTVNINNDTAVENNETFSVKLANATNASINDGTGSGTINDNDEPQVSIGDTTVNEDAGTTTFTISLDRVSNQTVTVRVYTKNGSATAGSDYTAINQTITFAAGETTKTITVNINNDTVIENNETFSVKLTDVTNASIDDRTGIGVINDNDAPLISIGNTNVNEKDGVATFTISLSKASTQTITVRAYSMNQTAKAGSDYQKFDQNIVFAPGETTKTITVQLINDKDHEATESFVVKLSNAKNGTITSDKGQAILTSDDPDPNLVKKTKIDINNTKAKENASDGTTRFRVTLNRVVDHTVKAKFKTQSDSAKAGKDFKQTKQWVVFNPGERETWVQVKLVSDQKKEGKEKFFGNLSNAKGATLRDSIAKSTIFDAKPAAQKLPTFTLAASTLSLEALTHSDDEYADLLPSAA